MFYDVFIGEKEFSKGNFFFRLDILILILIRIFIENFYATYKFIYRVLKGNYNPGVVRIKTDIKSLTGKVFLANAISSITGTVALWIDGKFIFVHWFDKITFNSIKAGKIIKGNIEKLTKRVFK
jgi:multicomponent Na+:H+ antiporter subunit E